jgi:hypothetical protein
MQGFEKVHVGSINSHLGVACSDQDYDYNGEDII